MKSEKRGLRFSLLWLPTPPSQRPDTPPHLTFPTLCQSPHTLSTLSTPCNMVRAETSIPSPTKADSSAPSVRQQRRSAPSPSPPFATYLTPTLTQNTAKPSPSSTNGAPARSHANHWASYSAHSDRTRLRPRSPSSSRTWAQHVRGGPSAATEGLEKWLMSWGWLRCSQL